MLPPLSNSTRSCGGLRAVCEAVSGKTRLDNISEISARRVVTWSLWRMWANIGLAVSGLACVAVSVMPLDSKVRSLYMLDLFLLSSEKSNHMMRICTDNFSHLSTQKPCTCTTDSREKVLVGRE